MVLNFQIEEVLDRLMKNEEAQKLSEAKKSELAKKFMLKWVDKKNTSAKKPDFEIPKVRHTLKVSANSSTLTKVNKLSFIPGNTVCCVTKETVRKKMYDFSLV